MGEWLCKTALPAYIWTNVTSWRRQMCGKCLQPRLCPKRIRWVEKNSYEVIQGSDCYIVRKSKSVMHASDRDAFQFYANLNVSKVRWGRVLQLIVQRYTSFKSRKELLQTCFAWFKSVRWFISKQKTLLIGKAWDWHDTHDAFCVNAIMSTNAWIHRHST